MGCNLAGARSLGKTQALFGSFGEISRFRSATFGSPPPQSVTPVTTPSDRYHCSNPALIL
jgi:hypothetical protein